MHVLNKKRNHNNIRTWNLAVCINNSDQNISQNILLAHILTGLILLYQLCNTWETRIQYFTVSFVFIFTNRMKKHFKTEHFR